MSQQPPENQQWAIYNRIKEYRRAGGPSQKELATELAINPRTVGYLERQDQRLDLQLAWKIADLFGVELQDVFFRDQYPPPDHLRESLASEPHAAQPSGQPTSNPRQRPASLSILTALLDGYGEDQEGLVRRARLDADAPRAEMYSLKEEGLVEESVQPGPVFGRPHSASYGLTSEGHRRIVEIHRNHLWREDA